MSAFEEVQKAVDQREQNGHAQRNRENMVSLKKANEEIGQMLLDKDFMREDMIASFKNDTIDIINEVLLIIDICDSRYNVDKKDLLAVLIEELEVNL